MKKIKLSLNETGLNKAKNLLLEFNNKDKQSILAEGDQFSVSYEIELETRHNMVEEWKASQNIQKDTEFNEENAAERIKSKSAVPFLLANSVYYPRSKIDAFVKQVAERGRYDQHIKDIININIAISFNSDLRNRFEKLIEVLTTPNTQENNAFHRYITGIRLAGSGVMFRHAENEELANERPEIAEFFESLKTQDQRELFSTYIYNLSDARGLLDNQDNYVRNDSPFPTLDSFDELFGQDIFDFYDKANNITKTILQDAFPIVHYGTEGVNVTVGEYYVAAATGIAKDYVSNLYILGIRSMITNLAAQWVARKLREAKDNFETGYNEEAERYDIEEVYRFTLAKYLPNFYKMYGNDIKVESDGSLEYESGLEFSMKKYLHGIDQAFQFLDILYKDLKEQRNFYMSRNTGLHTNVSLLKSPVSDNAPQGNDFNLIKGLLFLSEKSFDQRGSVKPGFAFKGIETRFGSRWTDSLKSYALSAIETEIRKEMTAELMEPEAAVNTVVKNIAAGNIPDVEKKLNTIIFKKADEIGPKSIGFNITYIHNRGYVEFRYPGHDVDITRLKELTLYYAHVVKLLLDPEYKKKEYITKLIGLINNIDVSKSRIKVDKDDLKNIKVGNMFARYMFRNNPRSIRTLAEYVTIRSGYDGQDIDDNKFTVFTSAVPMLITKVDIPGQVVKVFLISQENGEEYEYESLITYSLDEFVSLIKEGDIELYKTAVDSHDSVGYKMLEYLANSANRVTYRQIQEFGISIIYEKYKDKIEERYSKKTHPDLYVALQKYEQMGDSWNQRMLITSLYLMLYHTIVGQLDRAYSHYDELRYNLAHIND